MVRQTVPNDTRGLLREAPMGSLTLRDGKRGNTEVILKEKKKKKRISIHTIVFQQDLKFLI